MNKIILLVLLVSQSSIIFTYNSIHPQNNALAYDVGMNGWEGKMNAVPIVDHDFKSISDSSLYLNVNSFVPVSLSLSKDLPSALSSSFTNIINTQILSGLNG
jgi:hypothetical protein